MTKENQKKLYNHFVATKQKARAEELLKIYPDFKEKAVEIKEEKEIKLNSKK